MEEIKLRVLSNPLKGTVHNYVIQRGGWAWCCTRDRGSITSSYLWTAHSLARAKENNQGQEKWNGQTKDHSLMTVLTEGFQFITICIIWNKGLRILAYLLDRTEGKVMIFLWRTSFGKVPPEAHYSIRTWQSSMRLSQVWEVVHRYRRSLDVPTSNNCWDLQHLSPLGRNVLSEPGI